MRILTHAPGGVYVESPRRLRYTIKNSCPFAVLITRGRLSYTCEFINTFILFLSNEAIAAKVDSSKKPRTIVFRPFRRRRSYGVASRAGEFIDLLDDVMETRGIHRVFVCVPLASFGRILEGLRAWIEY